LSQALRLFNFEMNLNDQDGDLLYVKVDPSGVDSWKLEPVIEQLKEGAVGVIPTDTVYVMLLLIFDMWLNSTINSYMEFFPITNNNLKGRASSCISSLLGLALII